MPSQGPSLTFDPCYVTATIDAWRVRGLAPIATADLESEVAQILRKRFIAWKVMGMREQVVSMPAVTTAVGVLTGLRLARKTTSGRGETRVTILTITPDGRETLTEEPISGALYPHFAESLSKSSTAIFNLLSLLAQDGPYTQPVLHPMPGAPRRGAAYQAAIKEGLQEYQNQVPAATATPRATYEPTNPKATAAQRIKVAQTWASQAHPAGTIKQIDKMVAISLAFGLLWVDVDQINEVIGAKSIGLAATRTTKGYRPNIMSWPGDSGKFIPALIDAVATRDNGSGFATIQEVRGAIGRKLHLSPVAVDALVREARDAGDRHEISIELHFEPDEDLLNTTQRDPLIWREEAFEFITVLHGSHV